MNSWEFSILQIPVFAPQHLLWNRARLQFWSQEQFETFASRSWLSSYDCRRPPALVVLLALDPYMLTVILQSFLSCGNRNARHINIIIVRNMVRIYNWGCSHSPPYLLPFSFSLCPMDLNHRMRIIILILWFHTSDIATPVYAYALETLYAHLTTLLYFIRTPLL